jgi:hypothetical protein
MPRLVTYNQKDHSVVVNGVAWEGYADGASIKLSYEGGEVELTHGTDGPGLNKATPQGGKLVVSLQQISPSNAHAQSLLRQQETDSTPINVTIYTGTRVVVALNNCLMSPPGELSTGDKKQGNREYTFVGTDLKESQGD